MKAHQLIAILQSLPPYADVLIETPPTEDDGGAFNDFTIAMGDDFPADQSALIMVKPS